MKKDFGLSIPNISALGICLVELFKLVDTDIRLVIVLQRVASRQMFNKFLHIMHKLYGKINSMLTVCISLRLNKVASYS